MVALKIASRNFEPRSFEVLKKSANQISESSMDTKHHGKKFLSAIFSVIIYSALPGPNFAIPPVPIRLRDLAKNNNVEFSTRMMQFTRF